VNEKVQRLNNRANELVKQGKVTEAIELYLKAIRFDPTVPEVYFNLGTALASIDRFDEARVAFYKSKKLGFNNVSLLNLYLAYCECMIGNSEKAKRLCEKIDENDVPLEARELLDEIKRMF